MAFWTAADPTTFLTLDSVVFVALASSISLTSPFTRRPPLTQLSTIQRQQSKLIGLTLRFNSALMLFRPLVNLRATSRVERVNRKLRHRSNLPDVYSTLCLESKVELNSLLIDGWNKPPLPLSCSQVGRYWGPYVIWLEGNQNNMFPCEVVTLCSGVKHTQWSLLLDNWVK